MDDRIYRFYGVHVAVDLLRPGAIWEWTGGVGFTKWDDPRPCPTKEELEDTLEKVKAFEDSINTIYLPKHVDKFNEELKKVENLNSSHYPI